MLSRARPLFFIFLAFFLALTEARISLLERWLPSTYDSLVATPKGALQERSYSKRDGELIDGAPCAPADNDPQSYLNSDAEGDTCLKFPSPLDLGAQPQPGKNPDINARRSISLWNRVPKPDPESVSGLAKRAKGQARLVINGMNPGDIVPTNGGRATFWQKTQGTIDMGRGLATQDLCGCTVAVVASPFALIMIHILEDRDSSQNEEGWWRDPNGPGQQAADARWSTRGGDLLEALLKQMPAPADKPGQAPDASNSWNGWYPADKTTISIVAPQWNADYYDSPWQYPDVNFIIQMLSKGWVYPNQPDLLKRTLSDKIKPGADIQTSAWSYRRRYGNDPMHQGDDRDIVAVLPIANNDGTITAQMYFDDEQVKTIIRLK